MKSRAHFKTHPLHPILVVFPIAFFTAALFFDVLAALQTKQEFLFVAKIMGISGIAGGILAAIPGIIDYIYTVPPKSSAKNRATKHGLLNSSVLIIFIIVVLIRNSQPLYVIIPLEIIAVVILSIAGWMGGTLVHRNQIGVDIRYANAGKWKEKHLGDKSGKLEVATDEEIMVDQMKLIHVNKLRIVIAKTKNGFVAFDDRCPHKGASLAAGAMVCGTVQCPWHGSQFHTATGELIAGPAKEKIKVYPVSTENGKVFLHL